MDPFRSAQNLTLLKQVDRACKQFEDRLRAGQAPRIEDVLASVDSAARPMYLRGLLAIELDVFESDDRLPSVDEYLSRFPGDKPIVLEIFLQVVSKRFPTNEEPAGATTTSNAETADFTDTLVEPVESERTSNVAPDEQWFGDYALLAPIARGGMGIVYKARQRRLNRTVALKMILAGELASEGQVRRFYVEAEAAAKLDHPGIVPVYEAGQVENQHFYSMAYVEGSSLASRLTDGPFDPFDAARLIAQVARAVHYAHEQGVIHRDLKPQNVLIDGNGQPRVTDFGLARNLDLDSTLTASGQVMGTPSYMPPEQALGRIDQIGPAADVYSLGATLYHMITGQLAFAAETPMDTVLMVLEREPVAPRQLQPTIPRDLETICLKCLRKAMAQRYPTALALADDLQRFLLHEPILARPVSRLERTVKWAKRRPAVAALLSACLAGLLGYGFVGLYLYRSNPDRMRAEANKTTAEAKLRAAEAERLSAEAARLQKEKEKSAADVEKRQLEIQRETQKGLDLQNAWAQLMLDLKVINEGHTTTEARLVPERQRRGYDPMRPHLPYNPMGDTTEPWRDPFADFNSGFGDRYDPLSRVHSGMRGSGSYVGPIDPMTGRRNEFDPMTGQWRSPNQPKTQLYRYIRITELYQQEILQALNKSLDSLQFDERRVVFWKEYVAPNSNRYFEHVEKTEQFKQLRAIYQNHE
jgi:serine/threonine-protein kinase